MRGLPALAAAGADKRPLAPIVLPMTDHEAMSDDHPTSPTESGPSLPSESFGRDREIAQYRRVSPLAVVGLILGILSPLALLGPGPWLLAVAGVAINAVALWQIAHKEATLVGRKAAWAGLLLSVLFATAGPAQNYTYQWMIRREARQFAMLWFDALADNQPLRAHQLVREPQKRRSSDAELLAYYQDDYEWRRDLYAYLSRPLPRTLLALGHKAEVRYYSTRTQGSINERPVVYQYFAVSYDDEGQKKTFFVGVAMQRTVVDGQANWRLMRTDCNVLPEGLRAG